MYTLLCASGVHRFERGHHFVEVGQQQAACLRIECQWSVVVAHDVGHVNKHMIKYAVKEIQRYLNHHSLEQTHTVL